MVKTVLSAGRQAAETGGDSERAGAGSQGEVDNLHQVIQHNYHTSGGDESRVPVFFFVRIGCEVDTFFTIIVMRITYLVSLENR